MSFSNIISSINALIQRTVFPGDSEAGRGSIRVVANFISTHPLVLFFVLCSFLFLALSILRRMLRS